MSGITSELAERLAGKGISFGDESDLEGPASKATKPENSDPTDSDPEDSPPPEGSVPEGDEQEGDGARDSGPSESDMGDDASNIHSLTDLAKHLEVEPEFLYSLKIKLSDTGEEISIGAVKDKLQEAAKVSSTVASERAAIASERTALANSLATWRDIRDSSSKEIEESRSDMVAVENEYHRINWAELERIDPGRAALEQQKFMQRYSAAKSKHDTLQQQLQQQMQQAHYEARVFHDRALIEAVPEWNDQDRANKDTTDIVNWARSKYNFSDGELSLAVDWRHRDVLRKAWLYDKAAAEKANAVVATPPKMIKKGISLKKPDSAAKSKEEYLVAKARRTGRTPDKVAAAAAILSRAGIAKRQRQ